MSYGTSPADQAMQRHDTRLARKLDDVGRAGPYTAAPLPLRQRLAAALVDLERWEEKRCPR